MSKENIKIELDSLRATKTKIDTAKSDLATTMRSWESSIEETKTAIGSKVSDTGIDTSFDDAKKDAAAADKALQQYSDVLQAVITNYEAVDSGA